MTLWTNRFLLLRKTFPGITTVPQVYRNPKGLQACVKCGTSSTTIDQHGRPLHARCVL